MPTLEAWIISMKHMLKWNSGKKKMARRALSPGIAAIPRPICAKILQQVVYEMDQYQTTWRRTDSNVSFSITLKYNKRKKIL